MELGCDVRVIAPAAYYPRIMMNGNKWSMYARIPERDIIDDVPAFYPRYFRIPGKWFHPLSCVTQYLGLNKVARSIIRDFRPDVIHAHAITAAGFLGLLLKNKFGLPLVCSMRGSDINTYPHYGKLSMHLTKKVIAEADRLVSVSAALKDSASALAKAKNDVPVVYNGCDLNMFVNRAGDRRAIREKFGISESDKVLIFVGSITEGKGIFELTDAFTRLNFEKPGLRMFIIGAGPQMSALNDMVVSRRLHNRIHLTGRLDHNEIPGFLSASDVLVLPSHAEGLPNVVLEAMACGLPVVATRVGGLPEAVEEGRSGFLINKHDVKSLAEAIGYLIADEHLLREMGLRGRKIVGTKFSWKQNAEKMIGIYSEAINE